MVPLFHAAWLFAVGIALAQWYWLQPSRVLIALGAAGLLCTVAAFRAQRVLWIPLAALWCLLGAWCAEMEPQPAPAPQIATLSDGLLRTLDGTVSVTGPVRTETQTNVDEPSTSTESQRIDLRVDDLEFVNDSVDEQRPSPGGVRLTVRWPEGEQASTFGCGERIRATVRLFRPEVYNDAGAWNRAEYLLGQGITSTGSVEIAQVERLGITPGRFFTCRIAALQHAAAQHLQGLPAVMSTLPSPLQLSADDVAMLAAMTAGDRTYLTHTLRAGFERTGSFHMLVVAGFHLAIVAGCIFWLAQRLRLPYLASTLLTIAASFGYALLTGFAAPVQRSLWMVTLYLLCRLLYRGRSPLNAIGFAALCLLVASPHTLFDSGFQMTLLAVVAIAGVASPLFESTLKPYLRATQQLNLLAIDMMLPPKVAEFRVILRMLAKRLDMALWRGFGSRLLPAGVRVGLRCVEAAAVSCIVELAMTLPMALYFHRITLFALPVNLLILPLLAVLIPVALTTLAAVSLWPATAMVPGAVTALILHGGVGMVHFFGFLTVGDIRIPGPAIWQTLGFCALLALALLLARGGSWQRRGAWAAMGLAAVLVALPRPIDHPHDALLVEALDVGQGDSLLIIAPDGTTMLVDAGGFGGGPRQVTQDFDIGEEVVSPALWARGIRRLDVVALSHAHSDHMGGMAAVLRNFHPRTLLVGSNPPVAPYEQLLAEARTLNVQIRTMHAGDSLRLGNASVRALAPMRDYQPGDQPANNDSLVLRAAYGETSVLLEGDAEAPVEQAILATPSLQSTLLKVGHHGSKSSSTPEFLARVAPQWAVISCGLRNRYGHPRSEVLSELESAHVRTLSTDMDGAVCFQLNGRQVTADPFCGKRTAP
jgi:competence protein ComEC